MIFEKIQLEQDETIQRIVRRHWFYLFLQCLYIAVLILFPLIAFITLSNIASEQTEWITAAFLPHALFLYALWILINWMLFASFWTDYYLDIWCITNRRIIKVDQVSLFNRKTGSFRLERMQDVNVEVNGMLATFLDYGTIHIQTASSDMEEFKGTYLPKPQELKALILRTADSLIERDPL